jgi:hypothetical protein
MNVRAHPKKLFLVDADSVVHLRLLVCEEEHKGVLWLLQVLLAVQQRENVAPASGVIQGLVGYTVREAEVLQAWYLNTTRCFV